MPFIKIVFFLISTLFFHSAKALNSEDLLPPEQAFKVTASTLSSGQILLSWEIAEGYYLYKDKIAVISDTPAIQLQLATLPDGKIIHDEYFGEMATYRNTLHIPITLTNPTNAKQLDLHIKHQGCADVGVCYPPQKTALNIQLPPVETKTNPIKQLLQGIGSKNNALFDTDLLAPEQAFQFHAALLDANTLQVSWDIAEGYYLYRDKIDISLINNEYVRLGPYTIPPGIPEEDEAFGRVEIFYKEVIFTIPLLRNNSFPQTITLLAKYQGCAVRGVCYQPMQKTVQLQLPEADSLASLETLPPDKLLSDQDQIVSALHQDTLWLTLLSFFGFGVLLSFTPCIFPMIPILSGIIVGQGNNVTTRRAFLLSLYFVVASAITYTIFGVIAASLGSNLQVWFQQPWIIVLFSGTFILLSLSMFGFYNLEIPKSLQARLHNTSDKHRDGSFLGATIMGALSALIVGPCVAAPLAGALIYIGQTGDAMLGGSALFMMGLGMGVPLLILGASAGTLLPKAGQWMNATKAIFGVIMLAVAVWMLERILPASLIMFLWAMLLIIPAIYMSAIDPLPEHVSNWRKLWKGVGLMSLTYGIILLIGFGMGNNNPLKPLQITSINSHLEQQAVNFQRISSLQELDNKIKQASINKQWVMLDFYADWCISCKEMESYTFSDPLVKQQLSQFVLLQADVTKNTAQDKALLKQFNLFGPPAILFFSPDQKEQPRLRVVGFQDAQTFLSTLNKTRI